MKDITRLASLLICIALLGVGCDMFNRNKDDGEQGDMKAKQGMGDTKPTGKVAMVNLRPSTAATTQPSMNNVTGQLVLTEMQGDRVHMTGEVRGLKPNGEHGFHIHEKGDLSAPDLASAGAHYNPTGHKHGGPESQQKHVGDLGNIRADGQGVAKVDKWIENATLEGKNAIVSRSVLVHALPDDLKTDPSGNSGGRIAGGVIEMKK